MTAWPRLFATPACGFALACACAAAPPPGQVRAEVGRIELGVTLDPDSREFRAVAKLIAPADFRFALHQSLAVAAAYADERPVAVPAARPVGVHRSWQLATTAGAALRIHYGGALPALDRTLDHRGVLRDMPPMSSRAGSFLHAGSGWYPRPAALFSYRVTLSLPGDQRGLVAGQLVREELPRAAGERYVAAFEFAQPADGIDLMAGPYVVREKLVPRDRAQPLRLRTYFFSDLDALAPGYLEDSGRYIGIHSRQIGDYPFTGFSIVASPLPTGFGMPTLTYLGADVLKLPFIRATALGHEVLHNWWGNGVYVDYATGNWSEGLTTFMADYFHKERESPAAARDMRLGWLRDFAAVPPDARQPLSSFRSRTHGAQAAVGYGKAAMLFFMLRDAIGEEAFLRGVRLFWQRHRFERASWDDLRVCFEEAAGRSLDVFFTQWVQRAGGPALAIREAVAQADGGKTRLVLTLSQTAPAYFVRVPVEIVFANRTETRWVEVGNERGAVVLEIDAVPEAVRLDPDLRVWRVLDREELPPILRQWILARAPRLSVVSTDPGIRRAARALAERFFESPAQSTALQDAPRGGDPLLIVGAEHDVDAALSRLELPPRPAALANRGSAQAWTVRGPGKDAAGTPIAVISVRDAESLAALLRPLPHYGAQSYVIFEGGRAIERGVWPATARTVRVRCQPRTCRS